MPDADHIADSRKLVRTSNFDHIVGINEMVKVRRESRTTISVFHLWLKKRLAETAGKGYLHCEQI